MILLDTHVVLWAGSNDARLGSRSRSLIEEQWPLGQAAVSSISFWEIGMRSRKGHLRLRADLPAWRRALLADGLAEIPVDGRIATRAGLLEGLHGDPADRIIVASALEGHTLLTADRQILDWRGDLDRLDARQ